MKFILSFVLLFAFFAFNCKSPTAFKGYYQTDTTWVQCQGLPEANVTGFAASGNNIVAGTYNVFLSQAYIYISFDNGYTWKLDATFHVNSKSPISHLYIGTSVTFFEGNGYLLAGIQGGFSHGNIYISTNNGLSWNDKGISWPKNDTSGLGEDVNDFTSLAGNVYAGTDRGVFRTTDNGKNWISVNTGLPIPPFPAGLQVMRIVGARTALFAGTTSKGIFISNNNGDSWENVNSGLSSLAIYGLTVMGTNVYSGAFTFSSDSIGGVFLYISNESSWKAINNGLSDHKINILAGGSGYLFAGTNSGLFISANQGRSWSYDSIGTPSQSLAVISLAVINSHLYVGTMHGAWRFPISQLPTVMKSEEKQRQKK